MEPTNRTQGKRAVPKYVASAFGSANKFRAYHRAALQRARMALNDAWRGSVSSGDSGQIKRAREAVAEAIEMCRVKNWEGRR